MLSKMSWKSFRSEVLFFACILAVLLTFRTTAYGMYYIPSESMLPTLAVGDRILVNKFAYGYSRHSVPFSIGPEVATPTGRLFGRLPERGDLVVFKHPGSSETLIKRVIGLPGDKIELREGRLFLNDAETPRTLDDMFRYREHKGGVASVAAFSEILPGGREHEIYERGDTYRGDDFGPAIIPDNHLFVMGDNRDNSIDSRFPYPGVGFLPVENLVGRADLLMFSLNMQRKEEGLKKLTRQRSFMAPLQ
ncbi:signal peptidase I [Hyphococcus sp.]|uniref:signal peptidase I n=1 Tax=Hyphococcus sp. TaxID=2038636 RepID=UPI0035C75A32